MKSKSNHGADMYELFVQHIESIYWEGFAEQLARENSELYNFEYIQFIESYTNVTIKALSTYPPKRSKAA